MQAGNYIYSFVCLFICFSDLSLEILFAVDEFCTVLTSGIP